jgi:hypothetical protein
LREIRNKFRSISRALAFFDTHEHFILCIALQPTHITRAYQFFESFTLAMRSKLTLVVESHKIRQAAPAFLASQ